MQPSTQAPEQESTERLLDLSGKAAIVTGAAQGIGFAIASRLAEAGASVTIADLNETKGIEAADRIAAEGLSARFAHCDVSSEPQVKAMVAAAAEAYGTLDISVSNARYVSGASPVNPVLDMEESTWTNYHDTTLKGQLLCGREAARIMVEQGRGGRIINLASVAAFRPATVGLAHHCAAKGGVVMLTKGMALDLAQYGILVNAIAPGITVTEGSHHFWDGLTEETSALMMQRVAMNRVGFPDDIAKAALYLASDMASYVTGHVLAVDGGNLLF